MTRESTRAGRYSRQPEGFRAFQVAGLPPDPPVRMEGALQDALSRADRALGRLDGSITTLPNADLFTMMYVRKEAVLSSQIEGTQSSLQDVLAAEAKVLDPERPRDVDEVFNYVGALKYGLERLATLPVSVRLIREIHARLLKGVRGSHLTPGEIRRSQNWLGPKDCTPAEATFIPPPPGDVPGALANLEHFIHSDDPLPLLIRIGLVHAQFETIHPFLDGNGRVGRLLITFLLCEQKVLVKPVLYLSYFFKKHRHSYYEKLQAVRDSGDWEDWLSFFLQGVAEVSNEATETARKILALREEDRALVTDRLGRAAGNGHRVLEHLYGSPFVSAKDVERITGTTYPAANRLVARLADERILTEITGKKRNRKFLYRKYVDLFTKPEAG